MDLGLLGITGDEATARIKADPATKDIPVIVYTAFHTESALVERALAAGAAEVLHKPISVPDLQEKVHQYLSWEKPADMSGHP
jgi:putative two-component system response regulator